MRHISPDFAAAPRTSSSLRARFAALVSALPLAIALAPLVALFGPATEAKAELVTIEFVRDPGYYDPDHPMNGEHGPYDWIENGARYSGWWLNDVGTPAGSDQVGHTHLVGENDTVDPLVGDQQHAWRDSLQGVTISFDAGYSFSVVSIDARILSRDAPPFDPYNMQRLPWVWDLDDARLLLKEAAVDPVAPDFATFESQFVSFPFDDGSVWDNGDGTFDPNRPSTEQFTTVPITGFDDITAFQLSHSAGLVWIDNIVLDVDTSSVPEPGFAAMVGCGALLLAARKKARRPEVAG